MNRIDEIKFIKQDSAENLKSLRDLYLDSLCEPQEMFLELQVRDSNAILIQIDEKTIGYFLYDNNEMLLEFFVVDEFFSENEKVFEKILKTYSMKSALCKSFDQNLLSVGIGRFKSIEVVGINFRKLIQQKTYKNDYSFSIFEAKNSDFTLIKSINEEVFETDDEIKEYLTKKQILLFKDKSNVVGFGIFAPIFPDRKDYDIGMCVSAEFRGNGIGQSILHYLIDYCNKNGWRPIAGCDSENFASRKCLEKVGFFADYRMLLIEF